MTRLDSRKMRDRVLLRRAVLTDDGRGGQQVSWQDLATVWAQANSQNGREAVIAGTLTGVSSWRIAIRYSQTTKSITTNDQLVLNGCSLNIRSAEDPDGRREQIVIFADTASVQG